MGIEVILLINTGMIMINTIFIIQLTSKLMNKEI